LLEWAFLTNHSLVLSLISKHPRITGLELSREIGVTERTIRRIIVDLENAGYITKSKEGRCLRYRINPELSLRYESHKEIAIGNLLEILG